ncbi:Zinc finger C2CH-type [Trinorchestia longiramus]|nr:Zinc finger C2CH-type [Trinorchestia longiramus]
MNSWHSPGGRENNEDSDYFLRDQEHVSVNNGNALLTADTSMASYSASTRLQSCEEEFPSSSGVVYEHNENVNDDSYASVGENKISIVHHDVDNESIIVLNSDQSVNVSMVEKPLQKNAVKLISCGVKAINTKKCGLQASYFICSSEGCMSTSKSHLLYPFPKTPRIALSWLQRSGRENLVHHLGMNGSVPNNFLLCEKHFDDNQFVENTEPKELKKIAMPSLFLTSKSGGKDGISETKLVVNNQERKSKSLTEHFNVNSVESFSSSPPQCCDITFVSDNGTVAVDSALPKVCAVSLAPLKPSSFTLEFCVENDLGLKCAQFCKTAIADLDFNRPPHSVTEHAMCINSLAAKQQHDLAGVSQINVHISPQLRKKRGYAKPGPSSSKFKVKSPEQTFPPSAEMQRKFCADSFCSSDKDAVLFLFPISEDLCRAWMENIGDPSLLHLCRKHGYHCWHKAMTLCSDHFQPNCYQARRGRLRLVPNAVPTIFSHGLLSHPCRYVGRKPSVQDIQCGHDSCLAVAKKPWQSVEEVNYLKKRKRWMERMKCLANEASDEEDFAQHRRRNLASENASRSGKSLSDDSFPKEDFHNGSNSDESLPNLYNSSDERHQTSRSVDSTWQDDDLKPILDDPLVMKRAIKRFCDEQELQVVKRHKVESSRIPVVANYVPRTTKSRSRYPLREEAEKKIDLKQLSELDSEVKYLRKQLNILNTEHVRLRSAVFRASKNVRMEARMPLSLFFTPKDAFESFKNKLDVFTYGFIHQQQTHYSRPHWDPRSAKIPILMSRCSVQVWGVLQSLFKLPCKPSLFKYKAAARKDPSIFENSALMNEFVQKSYKSRFKRAKPRQYVRKNSLTGMTVSDVLQNYLKKHDIVAEV